MNRRLLDVLRAPGTGEALELFAFAGDGDVAEGILLARESRKAYPITGGVPMLLDGAFSAEFLSRHAAAIAADATLSRLGLTAGTLRHSSFSDEWDEHFDAKLDRTWGWDVDNRIGQFLLETRVDPEWCRGKWILDAGCGNGQLAEGLTRLGATVVGIDYATSVLQAERHRKSPDVHFVRGDLQAPPFAEAMFDLIISHGVIYHTASTQRTFAAVARLVKPGGHFYLWFYRKPTGIVRRHLLFPAIETSRFLVSRSPRPVQAAFVRLAAFAALVMHKAMKKHQDLTWQERVIGTYDTLTPRWRHAHTPLEVSQWFFENGFSPATLTHWDNPFGFGVVATRLPETDTPGINFGRSGVTKRYGE
ncbi:MAG TPA: methyltransferase domain-containing protein [Thermoanaerobaculia bacterium]|nr:methyltransferase domain-containing protein [Thermoanaerobaculia bacterium]